MFPNSFIPLFNHIIRTVTIMKLRHHIWIYLLINTTLCENERKTMDSSPTVEEKKDYYRRQLEVNFRLASATDPNAITYKLFTRENPNEEVILTEENVASQKLAKNVKTVLIIHGWTSNDSSPWYRPLKEAYLQYGSYNIIYVNWSTYGNLGYSQSSANVKPVGEFIARFLGKSGVPAKEIHLVGHSLGAQLSGFTGKAYKTEYGHKIGRITALDPAGPKWSNKDMKKEDRLSELDASFVDVVHTDIQMYGYTDPCGHVDYYPNGGTDQPGCPDLEEKENCNHHRSTRLFVESVHTQVQASEIIFKEDKDFKIVIKPKEEPKKVIFGEHVNVQDRGVYFLKTKSAKPFLK